MKSSQKEISKVTPPVKEVEEKSKIAATGLHVSGPLNSTLFTDCCGIAVLDGQSRCSCGALILRNYMQREALRKASE